MRPTRSHGRTVFPLSAALLFCALVNAQSPDPPLQGKATLVYIGSEGAKGKGIHLFRLQSAGDEVFQKMKARSSPRQMLFRPDGKFAYVLNEKSSLINVYSYDAVTGALTEVQAISTVPESYDGSNTAIELQVHHTGKRLYVSNTGHDSIVLFNVDGEKGTLTFVEEQGTGGRHARQFGIQPNSKHMAISLPDSNQALASRIDEGNGRLKPSGIFAKMPAPAAVRFLPPAGGEK